MRFDVVTLFPEIFDSITKCGITARAMKRGLWSCHTWNPRAMTEDVHRTVDDRPFGGGPGMVMMAAREDGRHDPCIRQPRPRHLLCTQRHEAHR